MRVGGRCSSGREARRHGRRGPYARLLGLRRARVERCAGFLRTSLGPMSKQVEIAQLKALSPLGSLKKDNLHALAKKTKIRDAQTGEALFREGDSEKRTVYVLTGTVELREGDQTV